MATPKEAIDFINKLTRTIQRRSNRIATVSLKAVEGAYKRRIFNKGLDANLRKIGNYSTKDILVGRKTFATKSGANSVLGSKKKRRSAPIKGWVTLRGNRLAILEGGYKKVRQLSGRQTAYVDLDFRGDLFRGIGVGLTPASEPALGFFTDLQRKKAEGNEERFKKNIFSLSPTEERVAQTAALRELDKIISKLI